MIERKQQVKQLRRSDIGTTYLKFESTSKFPRQIDDIITTWIRLSKLMKSRRNFHVEFRHRIDGKSTKNLKIF